MIDNFMDTMRWTLLFGKYTGIAPLVGLALSEDIPRFKWISGSTVLFMSSLIIQMFILVTLAYSFIFSGNGLMILNPAIFFGVNFVLFLLVLRLCQRCEGLVTEVKALEKILPSTRKPQASLKRINRFAGVLLFIGIAEHVLYLIYSMYMTHQCFKIPEDSGLYLTSYIKLVYFWYYEYFTFSYVSAVIFQVVKLQAAIMWVFVNVLVMVTCIYLKNRFQEFNRLIINKDGIFTRTFKPTWSELQVHYTRISKLAIIIDDRINPLVFFSYIANISYICMQMYSVLNKLRSTSSLESNSCAEIHSNDAVVIIFKIHYMTSLIMRTAMLSYLAAEVNVASRMPLMALHTVPSSAYTSDMRRLMSQVHYSKLGVSGLNFFQITRGMMLGMVAEIITYELVLVQF